MLLSLCRASPGRSLATSARRVATWRRNDMKMEALTSLYHQCDRYITPENLSDYIDEVFTKPSVLGEGRNRLFSQAELFSMKHHQEQAPKFFLGRDDHYPTRFDSDKMGPGWTDNKAHRIDRLYKELLGTDKEGRPSWIAVRENSRRIMYQNDEDIGRS